MFEHRRGDPVANVVKPDTYSVQRKAYLLAYETCSQYSAAETAKSYWKVKGDVAVANRFAKYNFDGEAESAASVGCLQAFRGYPKDPP